jgi:putative transposase
VEHHRDAQYHPAFQQLIDAAEATRVPLPPRSPNLNAYAERWVRSVKEECLSRLIRFGEASLRHPLRNLCKSGPPMLYDVDRGN